MTEIDCKFISTHDRYLGIKYKCVIRCQKFPIGSVALKGQHKHEKSNKDVVSLQIKNCDFYDFPENLQELFPGVLDVSMHECRLATIGHEHIGKWRKLQYFSVYKCGLTHLKGDVFKGLKDLEWISFKDNKIEEIEPEILDGLSKLRYADFSDNVNINMTVEADANNKSFERLKREIRAKCKPDFVFRSEFNEQRIQIRNQEQLIASLTAEIESLKQSLVTSGTVAQINLQGSKQSENRFKEIKITVENSTYKIDKDLLITRSKFLSELFANNPNLEELNIRDIPVSTFKAVHDFIYTEQLPADANYLGVFAAAARLKIDDLKEAAAAHLIETIDESNSFDLLVLSNKFVHEELRSKAFENIRTKIFPDRKLDDELAKEPEKFRNLIGMKRKMDQEFVKLQKSALLDGF